MKKFICPEPRVFENTGFKPFDLTKLQELEVVTDRGTDEDGNVKDNYTIGKCSENKTRLIMHKEAMGLNKILEDKYDAQLRSKEDTSDPTSVEYRKAMFNLAGSGALMLTTVGKDIFLARTGEEGYWNDIEVGRKDSGIFTS